MKETRSPPKTSNPLGKTRGTSQKRTEPGDVPSPEINREIRVVFAVAVDHESFQSRWETTSEFVSRFAKPLSGRPES